MEQEEVVIRGWCLACTCRPHYHIGQEDCINCPCTMFDFDAYRDSLDQRNLAARLQYEEDGDEEEEFELIETELGTEVYMGTASRGCSSCGEQKLYKDFNNSDDPEIICNYCLYEQVEDDQLDESLTDGERFELMATEDEIIENEMAYYEAQERQELITECLRGLDE